jgi:hypothetical protein
MSRGQCSERLVGFRGGLTGEDGSACDRRRDGEHDFELGVVTMNADWAVGTENFGRQSTPPD